MALLVEITGVDGSGKSTLIGLLRKRLNDQPSAWAYERTFRDRSRRFLEQIAADSGHHRADEIFDADLLAFSSAIGLVDEALRAFYFCRSNGAAQIYFVDQYYTGGIADAIARGVVALDPLKRIYGYLPRPHVSVFLDLTAEQALSRLERRASGDQILAVPSPITTLRHRVQAFRAAHEQAPYTQVRFEASEPIDEIVAAVLALVLKARDTANTGLPWAPIAVGRPSPEGSHA